MATEIKAAAAAEAAAEARQRAIEAARRAAEEAAKRAAEEAARRQAAQAAAKAQQQAQAKAKAKTFGKDDMSTGKGGALRRAAAARLDAKGLDPARPTEATAKTVKASRLQQQALKDSTASQAAQRDAKKLAQAKDPATRAKQLDQLVTANQDPAYQKALLASAKPQLEELSRQVTDKNSGFSVAKRQAAVDSLAKATEKLAPDAQQQLAGTFAGAMKNQNVGDDSNEFGTLLKNGVKDGSGASFGVRLASALQSSGKTTAANDASKFVGQGISDVRQDFEEAHQKVDELHAKLGSELQSWKLTGQDQTRALKTFDKENHLNDATQDLEAKGQLLASTLDGASIAVGDPALKAGAAARQPMTRFGAAAPRFGNESDLVSGAKDTLKDLPDVADTKAGAAALSGAVSASGEGKETFLDHLSEVTEKGEQADAFVNRVRSSVVQAVGTHLLESARAGTFSEESSKVLQGLSSNRALFGASAKQMDGLTEALGQFKPGMTGEELQAATQATGKKIAALGEGEGAVAQSLKGLSVVFGTIGAVKDWQHFSEADVQEKIATVSTTLSVGKEGANLVTSTLSRFAGDSAGEAAETAGLTAGKLLGAGIGALGSVVSGWQAVDAFKAGDVQAGVGDSLTAIGGAVATAGLFFDGTIAGAPAGVVLNVVGGVVAAAGVAVSLFSSPPNPFEGQEQDLGRILQGLGVQQRVANQLKDFNSDGQNFGTWVSAVAKKLGQPTGDLVRSMNGWSDQQVTDFLDAARLQHDTDSNNSNRLKNAAAVLGTSSATALEDARPVFTRGYSPQLAKQAEQQRAAQAALREQVNEKTGAITYDDALVESAAQWVRTGHRG